MKLVGTRTSPYVRKVRVILAERGIACDFMEESAWPPETRVPQFNPLNKVPALVLDGGESIYDSRVICEYLDAISGGEYIPADPVQRALARRAEALGDGIADAGVTMFLERKRDASRQDPAWVARQTDKVNAGIEHAARLLAGRNFFGGDKLAIGDIACGCALLWVQHRMPEFGWREKHPTLHAWAERLEMRPSFAGTKPPA